MTTKPPPRLGGRVPSPPWAEILERLRRIESRLVQLMRHQGMKTDGRNPLQDEHPPTDWKD